MQEVLKSLQNVNNPAIETAWFGYSLLPIMALNPVR